MLAPSARSTPELLSSFPLHPLVLPLSNALSLLYRFTLPTVPPSCRSCPSTARSASFAFVPFRPRSDDRSRPASSCPSCAKNDHVEGCAAKRAGKSESDKERETLERGDKRRGGGLSSSLPVARREGRFPLVGISLDATNTGWSLSLSLFAFPFVTLQSTSLLLPRKGEKMQRGKMARRWLFDARDRRSTSFSSSRRDSSIGDSFEKNVRDR